MSTVDPGRRPRASRSTFGTTTRPTESTTASIGITLPVNSRQLAHPFLDPLPVNPLLLQPHPLPQSHGILGSQRQWTHLIDRMHDDHRVMVPDLFGHGESDKPVGDYSLGAHAAALRDLLDRLGIERVTVLGHSLGGGHRDGVLLPLPGARGADGAGRQRRAGPGSQPDPALGDAARGRMGPPRPGIRMGASACRGCRAGAVQGGLAARHGYHRDLARLHLTQG